MKRSLLLLPALLALALAGCNPAGGTIKIGYIGPLTGDLAALGTDQSNGVRLAVDAMNAAGGVNGKKIQLIAEDGRCNAADAASAAQKLVNVDKVVAIVGAGCSSETLAAAPVVEAGKVVLLSPSSSSPDITTAGDYVFRNYPSDGLKGKALNAYFQKAGFKRIAIIGENTDFCQGIRGAVKKDIASGSTVVFDEIVDPGTKDYRTLLTRLKSVDFDVFLANGQSDSTVAEMVKQMRGLGMEQQIVGTDTADSTNIIALAGDAAEGLKPLSVPSLDESNAKGAAFAKAFREKHGEPKYGMFFAALAYDAANLLAKTIGEVGTDGMKIKDALYALPSYDGVAGMFHFDRNGDVIGIPFAMKEFKNGKLVQSEIVPVE